MKSISTATYSGGIKHKDVDQISLKDFKLPSELTRGDSRAISVITENTQTVMAQEFLSINSPQYS